MSAKLLKMAQQLISISDDLRYKLRTLDFDNGYLFDFDQTWESTALGFGGVGGSALTTERTYVFMPEDKDFAYVYFGNRFAYKVDNPNDKFFEDIKNCEMSSVKESGKYNGQSGQRS